MWNRANTKRDVSSSDEDWVMLHQHSALQSQKAVSAYFESKQILPFGFAR